MRIELSLAAAQVLSFPIALSVAMLGDELAQYGTILAISAFPFFMVAGALVQLPTIAFLRRRTRAKYSHFAIGGLALGLLPATVLFAANGGIFPGAAAAAWFMSSLLLFRFFARAEMGSDHAQRA